MALLQYHNSKTAVKARRSDFSDLPWCLWRPQPPIHTSPSPLRKDTLYTDLYNPQSVEKGTK